jgi:hypothetical protein
MFTVTLMGLADLSPELVEDVEIRYRDMLVLVLGDEEEVVAACTAHDEVVARYPDEPLPLGKTEAEQAAVKRWWAADRTAEMAAFVAWPIHPHDAFFEVTV